MLLSPHKIIILQTQPQIQLVLEYTFGGWALSGGGSMSGTTYTFGTSNGGTLTANWTANNYTITFITQWWVYLLQPDTMLLRVLLTYDKSFSFKGRMYAKPGYVLPKWNTKADGSGNEIILLRKNIYELIQLRVI